MGRGIALTTAVTGKTKVLCITGNANSDNKKDGFPATDTLQPNRGNSDAFVAMLDTTVAAAKSLLWNTYVGGSDLDIGAGVAFDGKGNVYVAGETRSLNFRPPGRPPVPGFQVGYGGGRSDGFVVEIAPNLAAAPAPRLGAFNNQLDSVDTLLAFSASAETFDSSSPTYSLYGAAAGAGIDPSSGAFTWTPTPSQVGTWTFYIDASDAEDDFDEQAVTVSVVQQMTYMSVNSSASFASPGQPVTFTATLVPEGGSGNPLPTGIVTFEDGTNVLGTANLVAGNGNSQAAFTTSTLVTGSHSIVAIYGSDSVYGDSSGSVAQTIGQSTTPSTTTSLSISSGQTTYGQLVTFTAMVNGSNGPPTGSVVFVDGLTVIGTAPMVLVGNSYQASLTTSTLSWGNHAITAVYSGDGNGSPSSASGSVLVLQGSTSTTLSSSANPSPFGQEVTFTATVAPTLGTGTPTGTITFLDLLDGTELGTVSLTGSNGGAQATLTTSALDYDVHPIIAIYSGDNNFSGNSSDSLDQLIS